MKLVHLTYRPDEVMPKSAQAAASKKTAQRKKHKNENQNNADTLHRLRRSLNDSPTSATLPPATAATPPRMSKRHGGASRKAEISIQIRGRYFAVQCYV